MLTIGDIFKKEYIVAGSSKGQIFIFDALSLHVFRNFPSKISSTITSLNILSNNTLLVGSTSNQFAEIEYKPDDQKLQLPKVSKFASLSYNLYDHSVDTGQNMISRYMAFTQNNEMMKIRTDRLRVELWRGHTSSIYTVAVSKGFCNKVFTGSYDSRAIGRSIFTMKIWKTNKLMPANYIAVILLNAKEDRVYMCGYNNTLSVLRVKTLETLFALKSSGVLYTMCMSDKSLYFGGNSRWYYKIRMDEGMEKEIQEEEAKEEDKVEESLN